jgi:hypothetical protein
LYIVSARLHEGISASSSSEICCKYIVEVNRD